MQENERKEKFLTDSDIEIKRVYNKTTVAEEQPGEFIITQGIRL